MVKLTDLGTPLAAYTGLALYTALATAAAYYAVVSTNTSDASPAYIGSAGPIAESVATPQPIKYADSLSRTDTYGKILTPAGKPIVFTAHGSGNTGGPATYSLWGDYWEWFLTAAQEGYQDGRPATMVVLQDNGGHIPSLSNALEVTDRDTRWKPDGADGGMEMYHIGEGLTPNPLVGPANRYYLTGCRQIARFLNWVPGHYGADANAIHWRGQSMGGWGGTGCGLHLPTVGGPHLAAAWLMYPVWRHDRRSTANWPGATWASTMPFKATVRLRANNARRDSIERLDGGRVGLGGSGGYADTPGYVAANPGADIAPTFWTIGKYDPYPFSFLEQIEAAAAFDTAHVGHAFAWGTFAHESTALAEGAINCDGYLADATGCYSKTLFKLNLPYIAFSSSSINDNSGTNVRQANGLLDGDYVGCIGCGFKWIVGTDTSGAFSFTVDNVWMDRSPTVLPTTTTSGTIASTGGATVAVGSTSGWVVDGNSGTYALVGDDASPTTQEVVKVTAATGGNVTYSSRGLFGTTAQSHAAGVAIKELTLKPTGPNGGPYSTMTVDVTPRRIQGFTKGTTNGQVISCDITPNGGSLKTQTPTVANGIFTLTGVIINATGATSIACS